MSNQSHSTIEFGQTVVPGAGVVDSSATDFSPTAYPSSAGPVAPSSTITNVPQGNPRYAASNSYYAMPASAPLEATSSTWSASTPSASTPSATMPALVSSFEVPSRLVSSVVSTELAQSSSRRAPMPSVKSSKAAPTYSVIVPVYNSTGTLPSLVERIRNVFATEIHASFEILLVDDGSRNPNTKPVLKQLQQTYTEVKVIELMRNYGQHASTLCGIRFAQGSWIITMDDDLQHLPEELPKLIAERDHDIVFARFDRQEQAAFRRIGSNVKNWLDGILFDKPKGINFSSFRLISRPVADYLGNCSLPYPYIPALLVQTSRDLVSVPVQHGKRDEGQSTYSILRLASFFGIMLFNHSALPLRCISVMGVSISILSFVMMIVLVVKRCVIQAHLMGWTSIIVTLLFIGGLLMLSMGVVGEYMVRVVAGIERRPMYVVRKAAGYEED